MKIVSVLIVSLIFIQLYACSKSNEDVRTDNTNTNNDLNTDLDASKMKITVGTTVFTATLNNSATATAFKARMPMTIAMNELNSNEKYFDLPNALPANALNPGAIQTGDLMLYGTNTLVLFYKSFSTSYSYTRIGKIEDTSGLAAALGSLNVPVTFETE